MFIKLVCFDSFAQVQHYIKTQLTVVPPTAQCIELLKLNLLILCKPHRETTEARTIKNAYAAAKRGY